MQSLLLRPTFRTVKQVKTDRWDAQIDVVQFGLLSSITPISQSLAIDCLAD